MFIPKGPELGHDPSSFAPCFFAGGKKPLNLPRLVVWLGFLIAKSKKKTIFEHGVSPQSCGIEVELQRCLDEFHGSV